MYVNIVAQSSDVISDIGYRYRQTQYYSVSGIGYLSGIVLTLVKIFEKNSFSLHYDKKNTLIPLVKSVFKSVHNYRRYLQFCDRRVCSFPYVATQRLQLRV